MLETADSPYIISFKEIYYDETYICIVIENMSGGDLSQILKESIFGNLSSKRVSKYVR